MFAKITNLKQFHFHKMLVLVFVICLCSGNSLARPNGSSLSSSTNSAENFQSVAGVSIPSNGICLTEIVNSMSMTV